MRCHRHDSRTDTGKSNSFGIEIRFKRGFYGKVRVFTKDECKRLAGREIYKETEGKKFIPYKVSVWECGRYIVKHCSLTEEEALALVDSYMEKGDLARATPHFKA